MWRLLFCSANCRFGTVLLLAGVLNGCFWDASSGNSGNRAVTEADTTPPVVESDTTPPAVRATNPVDGSEGVTRTGAITAEFDEDVFAQSVDEDSFTITRSVDSSGHSGTVTFDANSNTASFSPNTPLSMLKTYTATLSTAITDLSGNALVADHIWSFTAGDGTWKTAELIEIDNLGSARAPQIAIHADGRALAVWEQFDGVSYKIWSNHFDGSAWGAAELIGNGGAAFAPQIASNADGQALAVWPQDDGTRYNIWANRFDGSVWGDAELIQTTSAGDASDPQIAFNHDGKGLAVWAQFDGSGYNIWANRFDGSAWGAAVQIDDGIAADAADPQIAIDPDGRGIAVWAEFDGSQYKIRANRFDGSAWGTVEFIQTTTPGEARDPQIAISPDGQALAVWAQSDGSRFNIWANRFDGSGWRRAEHIETDNAGSSLTPQIVLDADGSALAVWQQFDGARYNIWANRFDGGAWGAAERIEIDNAGSAVVPQIALEADGRALAVWQQSDGSRDNIWANRFDGSAWGTAELIEADDVGHASSPQIGFDAEGRALAVWQQFDGARDNIWANRFE
ncbi:Ig-like domain-containing protein [Marinobacter alexandrii]|uniref:Ig-like domain-containing protein n=1 Tax=Marinobacter alexandrii TaxID=2570351 RepID=UPI00148603CA|nr:Ig-like domain-containing protein [Marinobacter alexandrii]